MGSIEAVKLGREVIKNKIPDAMELENVDFYAKHTQFLYHYAWEALWREKRKKENTKFYAVMEGNN